MAAFVIFDVDLQFEWALYLIYLCYYGHFVGLRFHKHLIGHNAAEVKRYLGMGFIGRISLWFMAVVSDSSLKHGLNKKARDAHLRQ